MLDFSKLMLEFSLLLLVLDSSYYPMHDFSNLLLVVCLNEISVPVRQPEISVPVRHPAPRTLQARTSDKKHLRHDHREYTSVYHYTQLIYVH